MVVSYGHVFQPLLIFFFFSTLYRSDQWQKNTFQAIEKETILGSVCFNVKYFPGVKYF